MSSTRIGLTQLPRKLAEHTGQPAPTYRKCFDGAVGARFPAEFANSRWTVNLDDLDVIASAMGLTATRSMKPARKAATTHIAT